MNSGSKPILMLLCLGLLCGCKQDRSDTDLHSSKTTPTSVDTHNAGQPDAEPGVASELDRGKLGGKFGKGKGKYGRDRGGDGKSSAKMLPEHLRRRGKRAHWASDDNAPPPPTIDWKQFRGPEGRASTIHYDLPTQWDDDSGVLWRVELIGRGASSPIVANDRIFLTAASGYGMSAEEPGDVKQLKFHLICLRRNDGQLLWQRDIEGSRLTQRINPEVLRHGFASNTPVADEDRVYAFLGTTGVFAFDHDGNLEWQADVGFWFNYFGSSASPILHEDLLIVNASIESEAIYGIEKATGRGVWKINGVKESFSMPVVAKNSEGDYELIVMEKGLVRGFDPATGKELWSCKGIDNYVVSTPFVHAGVCYCNGGIQRQMMAIKLGGRGDVTDTHRLWEVSAGANVPSPTLIDGQLYLLADKAIVQCYDARNGELISKKRLPAKTRSFASHLLANGLLYIPLEDDGVVVCEATSEFKRLSHNQFKSDKNSVKTSLVPTGRQMLLRNDQYLYLIGNNEVASMKSRLVDAEGLSETLVPRTRYDFSSEIQWRQPYLFYLDRHRPSVDKVIVVPYETLLSEEQVEKSSELITADFERFNELRAEHQEAYWQFLKSGSQDSDGFQAELKRIEKATEDHANKIRIQIKQHVMTEKQLEQHLRDYAERQKEREKEKK